MIRSFLPLILLPYGRRQPLLKPWRAHTSSWHCNTKPYFEHPKHGISREILRFYPSPLAILWKHTRQSNYRAQQDRIHLHETNIIISFENQSVLLHHIVGMIQYIYIYCLISYTTIQYCTYDMIQYYIMNINVILPKCKDNFVMS